MKFINKIFVFELFIMIMLIITPIIFFIFFYSIFYTIFHNNTIYCFFFERKEYNWYKKMNKVSLEEFYVATYKILCKKYPNYWILIYNNEAFIHGKRNTALTHYKRGSKKLYNKLLPLIQQYEKL